MKQAASTSPDPRVAARELHAGLAQPGLALVIVFASPRYDRELLAAELTRLFGEVPVVGCTTAGEITPFGYLRDALVAVGLGSPDFSARIARVDALSRFEFARAEELSSGLVDALRAEVGRVDGANAFALLLVDGLSMKEEFLVAALHRGLGGIQLFGGSAGDDTRFGETFVLSEGRFRSDAAILILVHTRRPFRVFKTQHFQGSSAKMVVTEADPTRRIVTEINGEPAGREYARMVGLEVDALTPLIFTTYPVIVRLGGELFVRSIQKVNPDESLTFFCAIDEGIVLTVARGVDLVDDLRATFARIAGEIGPPELVLGCDCVLRNLELDQRGVREAVSAILRANRVVGFATYGE